MGHELLSVVSGVVATFAVLAAWDILNSKYCESSGLDWGGIALGCNSASEGEMEGVQGRGHGKFMWCRDLCVTSWPHSLWGNRLYALHMHGMPRAE